MKMKSTNKIVLVIISIFIIGTIIGFIHQYTATYPSLKDAIKTVGMGGKEAASYDFDNGTFVFFKNSPIKYDFFYVKDKVWYNKGFIYTKEYSINHEYEITIYYLPTNKISFVKVEGKKEITTLKDSMGTEFTILSTDKDKEFYFGGITKKIPENYTMNINEEQYLVKEYNSLFKLFQ